MVRSRGELLILKENVLNVDNVEYNSLVEQREKHDMYSGELSHSTENTLYRNVFRQKEAIRQ